jgi:hypothetical protein
LREVARQRANIVGVYCRVDVVGVVATGDRIRRL